MRAFAPASVSNVGPGFDTFGFAVEGMGDLVAARTSSIPGARLLEITGDDGSLPREAAKNTAGIAASQVLDRIAALDGRDKANGEDGVGVELRLEKGMPLASGLGSSAASAVAAAVAVNAALGGHLSQETLLHCAIEGERIACGAAHGDNAAPSLYGGFVLVRGKGTPRIDPLPVPEGLSCAILRPHVAVQTGAARALLGDHIPLANAITQWGHAAALVAGLFSGDYELISSAIHDVVAEPVRREWVPGFEAIQRAALESGALGCSLSGSGPSLFGLCRSQEEAQNTLAAMQQALGSATDLRGDGFVSVVGAQGARVLAAGEKP
ncbi:MAG: homoserine kinase [Deltaproteobacteria bacterium]|nr:homoserine kinase [Deltaproteobacteria bacterium]